MTERMYQHLGDHCGQLQLSQHRRRDDTTDCRHSDSNVVQKLRSAVKFYVTIRVTMFMEADWCRKAATYTVSQTRSSATAEKQRVSYTRLPGLVS